MEGSVYRQLTQKIIANKRSLLVAFQQAEKGVLYETMFQGYTFFLF